MTIVNRNWLGTFFSELLRILVYFSVAILVASSLNYLIHGSWLVGAYGPWGLIAGYYIKNYLLKKDK